MGRTKGAGASGTGARARPAVSGRQTGRLLGAGHITQAGRSDVYERGARGAAEHETRQRAEHFIARRTGGRNFIERADTD